MLFKTAYRNLIKQKKSLFINLTGLSVGMAAALLILLWVDNELNYDSYHPQADQIYRVTNHLKVSEGDIWVWENSPVPLANAINEEIPEVAQTARLLPGNWTPLVFEHNGEWIKEKNVGYVDSTWFNMFHYDKLYGSFDAFFQQPYGLVMTASTAKKYFGTENVVGQTLKADSLQYTVRAVVADPTSNSSFQFSVISSIETLHMDASRKKDDTHWGNFNYMLFVKLHGGSDKQATEKKITSVLRKRKDDKDIRSTLVALKDMHFETGLQYSQIRHSNKSLVNVFSIVALLIILTACINYVNLSTARASLRAREVSIRKITGAGNGRLFLQFMLESLLVSLAALIITLILVQLSLPFFNRFTENNFSLSIIKGHLLWLIVGILLIATLLNGIYPAILLISFKPLNVLRGSSLPSIRDGYFRKALVVTQFTISVVLIAGTLIAYQQMQLIQDRTGHYQREQVMRLEVPWSALNGLSATQRFTTLQSLKPQLMQIPGVIDISASTGSIVDLQNASSGSFDWDGRNKEFNPTFATLGVDTGFARIFGLQMKEGEWFTGSTQGRPGYILNETAVKEIGIRTPVIGQRFTRGTDTGTIIGVVKDFHFKSVHEKISPMLIQYNGSWFNTFLIQVVAGNPKHTIAGIEKKWKSIFPKLPFEYNFLNEDFDNLYKADTKLMTLMLLFALITIGVAALGLFGLAAFTAEKKVKEIGIRKVLGASVLNIVQLISREFMWLVLTSVVVAIPLAWWGMHVWLSNYQYRVGISVWIFLIAGIIALFIALATVGIQAVRAARANPVKSLRAE